MVARPAGITVRRMVINKPANATTFELGGRFFFSNFNVVCTSMVCFKVKKSSPDNSRGENRNSIFV
jgi:hypothetical protein